LQQEIADLKVRSLKKTTLLLLTLFLLAISSGCSSSKVVDGDNIEKEHEGGNLPSGGK
jgi:hypothetical protein